MNEVQPEKILKELRGLWVDLGKQEENGVLRACSMTLIVVAEESEDTAEIGETIAALMHEHPSRAIVLRVREGSGEHLEARVFAQCWMPFGRRQQICCEQVEIIATESRLDDVRPVLLAITVPDLPVVLFCPSQRLLKKPGLHLLLPLADKLILDSSRAAGDGEVLESISKLPNRNCRKADLAWGRLTPWREAVAQIFETPEHRRAVYALENINMLYNGAHEPTSVYYLAGWFMHVLGSGVHLNIAPGAGPSYASIARVDLHGRDFEATLDLVEENLLELRVDQVRQRIVFPPPTDYQVLRQELGILGRDMIFDDALGLANLMRSRH